MKPIKGFERYYATEDGHIWNGEKHLCEWVDNVGYKQTLLYQQGKRCHKRVHRLIAETLIPNDDPSKTQVNHKNGDKTDNRVENLEWVTNAQNTQHGYAIRESNYCPRKVKAVCKTTGIEQVFKSIRQASDVLGVNRKTMSAILDGRKVNNYNYEFYNC